MAKTWRKTTAIDVSPERLLEVFTSAEFQVANARLDPAVVDTEYQEVSRAADRLVFEVRSTEYARSLTGIDKKKTERSTTRYEFDLDRRRGTWVYRSDNAFMDRVKVSGTEAIEGSGDKAQLVSECTLEVKVPLIGGKVESFILKEIESQRPGFEATLRDRCKRAS